MRLAQDGPVELANALAIPALTGHLFLRCLLVSCDIVKHDLAVFGEAFFEDKIFLRLLVLDHGQIGPLCLSFDV